MDGDTKKKLVERLRASRDGMTAEGERHGREWACNTAEYASLKRLADVVAADREVPSLHRFLTEIGAETDDGGAGFFGDVVGDVPASRYQNPAYLRGFVAGAVAVFNEVKAEL